MPPKKPPLPDSAVRDILTAHDISHSEMARRLNRSHQTIAQIRLGQVYGHRLPELPRWSAGRSCEQCQHWAGRCDLGFPDPVEEGTGFAREGACFLGVTA